MTSGLEFEGKDVEDAVKSACAELNIAEDKLKYDVISYGSTGIFGLVGVKKAKIRVFGSRKKHEKKKSDPPKLGIPNRNVPFFETKTGKISNPSSRNLSAIWA